MPYTDKELTCVECSTVFTFSADQQEHFAQLGFQNEPKRCRPCAAEKKKSRGGSGGPGGGRGFADDRRSGPTGPREMHSAVCAECSKPCQVPFKPRGDRPVYCSDCFSKHR